MPWWSWIVIWIALIALSLLYIGLLGLWLFRRLMATKRALGEASAALSAHAAQRAAALAEPANDGGTPPRPGTGAAVFASPEQMKDDYSSAKAARQPMRRQRRIALRTERHQLRSLRDMELKSSLREL